MGLETKLNENEILLITEDGCMSVVTEGRKLIGRRVKVAVIGSAVSEDYIDAELSPRLAPLHTITRLPKLT